MEFEYIPWFPRLLVISLDIIIEKILKIPETTLFVYTDCRIQRNFIFDAEIIKTKK